MNPLATSLGGRRSRRQSLAITALCSMLVLPACSGGPDDSEGITLHVFGPNSTQKLAADAEPETQAKIQQEVIDGFLKENPEVKDIVWDAQGDRQNSTQRLITANLSDQQMDLVACDANGTNSSYVRNGALKSFSNGFIDSIRDRVDEAALDDYVIDGKSYGVPLSAVSVTTMFYNVELFKKLGIDPPTTYKDLLSAAKLLQDKGITPVGFQGANAGLWSIWYTEALAQTQEDPVKKAQDNLAGTSRFDDASDVQAFQMIRQWIDDGVLGKDTLGLDSAGLVAEFAAGRVAMIFDGTFRIPQLKSSVTDFTLGASAFPAMPSASYEARHGGGPDRGMCLSAKIDDSHVEAAESFVEYLTRSDVANKYLAPLSPIESSVKDVEVSQESFAVQLREDVFPDRITYLDWIWPAEVTAAINASLQGVVSGSLTPQKAAEAVQKAYDDLVKAGNWPPSTS